jgi:hypothetical protein
MRVRRVYKGNVSRNGTCWVDSNVLSDSPRHVGVGLNEAEDMVQRNCGDGKRRIQ